MRKKKKKKKKKTYAIFKVETKKLRHHLNPKVSKLLL